MVSRGSPRDRYVGDSQGTLHVIADHTVWPPDGQHCEYPPSDFGGGFFDDSLFCAILLMRQPPIPHELTSVSLDGGIRMAPALARGRVYVVTDEGHLYALATGPRRLTVRVTPSSIPAAQTVQVTVHAVDPDINVTLPPSPVSIAGSIVGNRNGRSEEHTSELQSRQYLVCRLLLEKKKK